MAKLTIRWIMLTVLSALWLFGCSEASNSPVVREISVFSDPVGTVLVTVNGDQVTVGDFIERVKIERAIFLARKCRNIDTATSDAGIKRRVDNFTRSRCPIILADMVNHKLIRQYLRNRSIFPTAETVDKWAKDAIARITGGKDVDVGDFARRFAIDRGAFVDCLVFAEYVKLAIYDFNPESKTVLESEIDAGLKRQDDYKALAIASNSVTFAACSNLLASVRGGDDFYQIAKNYPQIGDNGCEEWDCLTHDEFTNKDLEEWAFSAPVGSVGGPYEMDDCIAVFKILGRENGTKENSIVSKEVSSVRLSRIAFPVIDPEPEPHTREFVEQALHKWKERRVQKALLEMLHAEMDLKYPNGKEISYKGELK